MTGKFIIQETITYGPSPDQKLATQKTDANGMVQFVVKPNSIGGYVTSSSTEKEKGAAAPISTVKTTDVVPEAKPDFGIDATGANGRALARRRLVVLNATTKQIGTQANPIVVTIQETSAPHFP